MRRNGPGAGLCKNPKFLQHFARCQPRRGVASCHLNPRSICMAKDLRAFVLGLLVFAGLCVTYLAIATRDTEPSLPLRWLATAIIYSAPVFAGFVCRLLAPSHLVATLIALG